MTSNDQIIINMLNGINTRFDRLDEKVDTLAGRVDRLDEKVEKLSSRVDAIDEKVDTLSNKVDGLSVRVGNLEQTTAQMQNDLLLTNSKIDWLQHSIYWGFAIMTIVAALVTLWRDKPQTKPETAQKSGFTFSDLAALLQIALGRENNSYNSGGR